MPVINAPDVKKGLRFGDATYPHKVVLSARALSCGAQHFLGEACGQSNFDKAVNSRRIIKFADHGVNALNDLASIKRCGY
jgi:hypothetical protein